MPACGSKRRPLLQPQYIAVKMKRPVVVFRRYDQPQLVNSVLLHRVPPRSGCIHHALLMVVATASVLICLLYIALQHGDSESTLADAKLHLPRVITILYGDS